MDSKVVTQFQLFRCITAQLPSKQAAEKCLGCDKCIVGAVYDRAYFVDSRKSARSQTAPTVAVFDFFRSLLGGEFTLPPSERHARHNLAGARLRSRPADPIHKTITCSQPVLAICLPGRGRIGAYQYSIGAAQFDRLRAGQKQ